MVKASKEIFINFKVEKLLGEMESCFSIKFPMAFPIFSKSFCLFSFSNKFRQTNRLYFPTHIPDFNHENKRTAKKLAKTQILKFNRDNQIKYEFARFSQNIFTEGIFGINKKKYKNEKMVTTRNAKLKNHKKVHKKQFFSPDPISVGR